MLDEAKMTWALLTGSTPVAERRRVLGGLADGSIQVALGTHALLEEAVSFKRLTLSRQRDLPNLRLGDLRRRQIPERHATLRIA